MNTPKLSVLLESAVGDLRVVVVVITSLHLQVIFDTLSDLELTPGVVDGLETADLALVFVQES